MNLPELVRQKYQCTTRAHTFAKIRSVAKKFARQIGWVYGRWDGRRWDGGDGRTKDGKTKDGRTKDARTANSG